MKRFCIVACALYATIWSIPSLAASEAQLIEVCEAAQKNDTSGFRAKVRNTRQKLRDLYPGIECNSLPLVAFAMKYNSEDVASYIISRTKSSDLRKSAGNVDLQEWFLETGNDSSAVYAELVQKIQ